MEDGRSPQAAVPQQSHVTVTVTTGAVLVLVRILHTGTSTSTTGSSTRAPAQTSVPVLLLLVVLVPASTVPVVVATANDESQRPLQRWPALHSHAAPPLHRSLKPTPRIMRCHSQFHARLIHFYKLRSNNQYIVSLLPDLAFP
jgi:hypothetical protein